MTPTVYDPNNDPGGGGTHHDAAPATTPYNPSQDPGVGTGAAAPATPADNQSFLSRSIASLYALGKEIATPTPATEPPPGSFPAARQFSYGFTQGAHDVFSTVSKPLVSDDTAQQLQQQNDDLGKQAGDGMAGSIGRAVGQTVASAPIMAGVGGAVGTAARTVAPGLAPAIDFLAGTGTARQGAGLIERGLVRAGSQAAQGAIQGAANTVLTGQGDVTTGAEQGAVLGPVLGAALSSLRYPAAALTGRLPGMVRQDVANLADRAQNVYGIDIDPAQLASNQTYRIALDQSAKMPFSGVDPLVQRRAWQNAVAQQFGENAPNGITYDVMHNAQTRIGQQFNDIAARTNITADNQLLNDMGQIGQDMGGYSITQDQANAIQRQARNVLNAFQQGRGTITGAGYQNLTQTGGPLSDLIQNTDPTVSNFGLRIRDALDGAFQRSATLGDQAALAEARQQYRNMMTVRPLVEQRGQFGDINPSALKQQVIAQSRRFDPNTGAYAFTGGGPMGELADIGTTFFSPQPESGTAMRNLVAGGILGGGIFGHPLAAAGTAATLAANRLANNYLRNPAIGRAMVANSLNPVAMAPTSLPSAVTSGAINLLNLQ